MSAAHLFNAIFNAGLVVMLLTLTSNASWPEDHP
jgi:hypothetical protein